MVDKDDLAAFVAAVRGAYSAGRETEPALVADFDILIAALDGLTGERVPVDPEDQPVCRHLEATLDMAEAGPASPIAAAIRPLASALGWRHRYDVDHKLPNFSRNYAHAEIVGPPGPVFSQDLRCGLILQAPQTLYPTHSHTAVELYLVLGGTAEWQRGTEPWLPRPPGTFILHSSGIGHAMRTGEQPMLALFAWHGVLKSDLSMPLDDL